MSVCIQRIVISISFLVGGGLVAMSDEREKPAKSDKAAAAAPDYDAMIGKLASRNPEPKIVKIGARVLPLFPKDYDWAEYDRVAKVRFQLLTNEDPRLWEYFLKHMDDKRYALTAGEPQGVYSQNYSVGNICWDAAWARQEFAQVHMKVENGERSDLLRLDLGNLNLPKWRKDRSEKALYELQIEVCEKALEKIKTERDFSPAARVGIERELRDNIKLLTKTKKALFFSVQFFEEFEVFNAKKAAEIRDEFEQEKEGKKE
jgi:hypothetical protein